MFDEYKNNSEYLRIAERCNESLQNANISEEDRESIYLTTYAFLNSVAKEYHLNDIENKIYDNLSKLESIKEKESSYFEEDELGHFAVLGDDSVPSSTRLSAIYLIENISGEDRFRTLTHELCHLYQQEYKYDENKEIDVEKLMVSCKVPNSILEATTELDSRQIMSFLGAPNSTARKAEVDTFEENTRCAVTAYPGAYATITPIVQEINRLDGDSLHKSIYYNSDYEGYLDIKKLGNLISNAYDTDNIKYYQKAIEILEKQSSEYSPTEYLKNISYLEERTTWTSKDNQIAMSDVSIISDKKILDSFYTAPDGDKKISDLDHITRSQDAEVFLMAVNGLKKLYVNGEIELNEESIENIKYKILEDNDFHRTIAFEYEGKQYITDNTIARDFSTSSVKSIKNAENIDFSRENISTEKKPLDFERMIKETPTFKDTQMIQMLRPSYGEESQYFAHMCNATTAPNILSATKLSSYDTTKIRDINDNNLAHILAANTSHQSEITMKYFNQKELAYLMTCPNKEGITPIDIAVKENNASFLLHASDLHVNVNFENGKGTSPLLESCAPDVSPEITNILLNKMNANPNKLTSVGISPLNALVEDNIDKNREKIIYLLNSEADATLPSYIENSNKIKFPLETISGMNNEKPDYELFETAVKNGADIFVENEDGKTVYDHMCESKDIELFSIALKNGYDKDELDIDSINFSEEDKIKIDKLVDETECEFDFSM